MTDNTQVIEVNSQALQRVISSSQSTPPFNELSKEVVSQQAEIKVEQRVSEVSKSQIKERLEDNSQVVEEAVENLNAFVKLMRRDVYFSIDESSGKDVISVFASETQELIRQIPSEEALKLLKRMDETIGLLFSEKV